MKFTHNQLDVVQLCQAWDDQGVLDWNHPVSAKVSEALDDFLAKDRTKAKALLQEIYERALVPAGSVFRKSWNDFLYNLVQKHQHHTQADTGCGFWSWLEVIA